MAGLAGQGRDLDQVVGQDPVSGPCPGTFSTIQAGAVPAVATFEGAECRFAAGPPLDCAPERPAVLGGLAGLAGFALAGDHDGAHAEGVQVVVDTFLAIA